jgi:transcriptional regulator with XRE-family HTH domain
MAAAGNFWGELVVQLRKEQKISQRKLAEEAHVNRSTLRRIEECGSSGDIEVMERILNYLGYELEAITSSSLADKLKARAELTEDPVQKSKLAASRILAMSLF